MAWIYGSSVATGVHALADFISEAVIGISLQTISAVAAAGADYVVGDEIVLSGGTSTIAAIAEVLTVDGSGGVLTVRVRNAGIYVAGPASPVSTTGGAGTGCTLTCTFGHNGWVRRRAVAVAGAAQSATIAVGGTDYVVGNTLTLSGGTGHTASTFRVATIGGGGAVASVTLLNAGSYTTPPSSPISTTGGAGTGCTLTGVFGTADTTLREVILEGEGDGGTDEIFVGLASDFSGSVQQLDLAGMTGYLPDLPFANQPGISPVRSGDDGGCFCPAENFAMNVWVSVTPRRIAFVYRVLSFCGSGHLGFLNPFLTTGEWSYPMFVSGYSNDNFGGFGQFDKGAHLGCPGGQGVFSNPFGGGYLRKPDGVWVSVFNTIRTDNLRGSGHVVWPSSHIATSGWPISTMFTTNQSAMPFDPRGVVGTNFGARLFPTPNTDGDLFLRVPCTVMRQSTIVDVPGNVVLYGQLDGVFVLNTVGLLVAENRIREGAAFFTVFSPGTLTDSKSPFCLEEK